MEISDLLPITNHENAYRVFEPENIRNKLIQIEVEYNPILFDKEPEYPDFLDAFQKYYSNEISEIDIFEINVQPQEYRRIDRKNNFSFGLDTNKKFFYFRYDKSNANIENLIYDFINILE
jgi:hypothetical protein